MKVEDCFSDRRSVFKVCHWDLYLVYYCSFLKKQFGCECSKFRGDTKTGGILNSEGYLQLQQDL